MIRPREEETYVFSRVFHAARDVVAIDIKCTRVTDTDPTIVLRSNWCCLRQRIWFGFGKGDVASGRVISAGGHNFKSSTKPSKSFPNMRDVNWSRHVE